MVLNADFINQLSGRFLVHFVQSCMELGLVHKYVRFYEPKNEDRF
jgi:hypothetical protein